MSSYECMKSECNNNNGNCDQLCVETYDSYYCDCMAGWKLRNDPYDCGREYQIYYYTFMKFGINERDTLDFSVNFNM